MPEPEEQPVEEEIQKISINGQEYDPTEAQEYIELGRKTRDAETRLNVKFDDIMPAYQKANEKAKLSETELSEARAELESYRTKKEAGTETQQDFSEAKEAAKKLGLLTQDDIKDKYVSREDLDKYYDEREQRRDAIKAVNKEADELATELDGTDGRPKFNKKIALAYAQAYNLPSLKAAYEDMHADTLSSWQKGKITEQRKPGLKTLASQPGNKEPVKPQINKDNADDALHEALFGAKE